MKIAGTNKFKGKYSFPHRNLTWMWYYNSSSTHIVIWFLHWIKQVRGENRVSIHCRFVKRFDLRMSFFFLLFFLNYFFKPPVASGACHGIRSVIWWLLRDKTGHHNMQMLKKFLKAWFDFWEYSSFGHVNLFICGQRMSHQQSCTYWKQWFYPTLHLRLLARLLAYLHCWSILVKPLPSFNHQLGMFFFLSTINTHLFTTQHLLVFFEFSSQVSAPRAASWFDGGLWIGSPENLTDWTQSSRCASFIFIFLCNNFLIFLIIVDDYITLFYEIIFAIVRIVRKSWPICRDTPVFYVPWPFGHHFFLWQWKAQYHVFTKQVSHSNRWIFYFLSRQFFVNSRKWLPIESINDQGITMIRLTIIQTVHPIYFKICMAAIRSRIVQQFNDNEENKNSFQWGWPSGPCFAQIHSAVPWLTRSKEWKEFPGVCTTVVLVKPSVVPFDLLCGDRGLSSETLLFFTYWLYWTSLDGPDISGIASCGRLCHPD